MSNIGPPNWWLRDKMIELTDKTLDVINNTEKRLNTKIDDISKHTSGGSGGTSGSDGTSGTDVINRKYIYTDFIGSSRLNKTLSLKNVGEFNIKISITGLRTMTITAFRIINSGKLNESVIFLIDYLRTLFTNELISLIKENPDRFAMYFSDIIDIQNYTINEDHIKINNSKFIKDINISNTNGVIELQFSDDIINQNIESEMLNSNTRIDFNGNSHIEQILPLKDSILEIGNSEEYTIKLKSIDIDIESDNLNIYSDIHANKKLNVGDIFTNTINYRTIPITIRWVNNSENRYILSVKEENIIELHHYNVSNSEHVNPYNTLYDILQDIPESFTDWQIFLTNVTVVNGENNENNENNENILSQEKSFIIKQITQSPINTAIPRLIIDIESFIGGYKIEPNQNHYNGIINLVIPFRERQIKIPDRVAFGGNTQAFGKNSISSGTDTAILNGENNIVSGSANMITGNNSIISGSHNNLSNVENSLICGRNLPVVNILSNSILSGDNNNLTGNISNSIICGVSNILRANVSSSIISGRKNLISNNINNSGLIGRGLLSYNDNCLTIGEFNNNVIKEYYEQQEEVTRTHSVGIGGRNMPLWWGATRATHSVTSTETNLIPKGNIIFDVGSGTTSSMTRSAMRIFHNDIVQISGALHTSSDRNIKSNITDISGNIAYQIINNIDIKHFYKHKGYFITNSSGNLINTIGTNSIGFIAQNVSKHIKEITNNFEYDFINEPSTQSINDIDTIEFVQDISFGFLTNDSLSANTLFIPNASIFDTSFIIFKDNGDQLINGNVRGNQTVNDVSSVYITNYEDINQMSLLSLTISAFQELSKKVDNILGNLKNGEPLIY